MDLGDLISKFIPWILPLCIAASFLYNHGYIGTKSNNGGSTDGEEKKAKTEQSAKKSAPPAKQEEEPPIQDE